MSNSTVSQEFVPPKSTLYMHTESGKSWLGTARPPSLSHSFSTVSQEKYASELLALALSLSIQTQSASK